MWFTTALPSSGLPFPYVVLTWNTWDDYGYKTTFNSRLWLSSSESVDLRTIKILRLDQQSGPTSMPSQAVQELGSDYCSVGSDLTYYETLFKLGPALYEPYLRGIADAAYSA